MGDQPPPRTPVPAEGAQDAAVPSAFSAPAEHEAHSAVLPHQVPRDATMADKANSVDKRLHQEISQELRANRDRLRGNIYLDGYREPDLSVLENDTHTRYYQARSKSGFAWQRSSPWPLLKKCYGYARLDFHRREARQPEPMEELPLGSDCADSPVDRVTLREAIKAFLERHLPDKGQREVYRLTHMEGLGPVAISERLGIDRKTVASRLGKAEKQMRSLPPGELDALR